MSKNPTPENSPMKPVLMEKQLRAMSRKHLLMMIRDLERELSQVKTEKEDMLLAFRAGVELPPGFVVNPD